MERAEDHHSDELVCCEKLTNTASRSTMVEDLIK